MLWIIDMQIKNSNEGGSMFCKNGDNFLRGVEEESRKFNKIGCSPNAFMNNDNVSICVVFIERILFFLDCNDFFVVFIYCLDFVDFVF
jgi:hypothetical protein